MSLSSDLVSQFVKITKDEDKTKKETTVYGTAKVDGNGVRVQIDGSEILTPVAEAVGVSDGDRVTVLIKNHKAILNGNLDSPAVSTGIANGTYATVGQLRATNAEIDELSADHAEFVSATAESFTAVNAKIDGLDIDDAAKTATNFMSFDSDGLQIGDKSTGAWTGFRTQITSAAFNILNAAGTTLASYGDKLIELGKNAADSVITLCGGHGRIEYNAEIEAMQLTADSVRLSGIEMTSMFSQSASKLGAVHASPAEVQVVAGSGGNTSNLYVKPTQILLYSDNIRVDGTMTDVNTGGTFVSVVEGSSGIWTYRKYSNGDVELWGTYWITDQPCTTALGSMYRTPAIVLDGFPFTVYDPFLTASYETNGYGALLLATTNTTNYDPPNYYLIRPVSGTITLGKINLHVRGRWK